VMERNRSLLWDFVERCRGAPDSAVLASIFVAQMEDLGFAHVALCSHVDPLRPPPEAVAIFKYPSDWLAHFSAEGYQDIDPVFIAAKQRLTPFQWRDPTFMSDLDPVQQRILAEGGEAGLKEGFTIPIQSPGALAASCSLVAGPDGADPLHYSLAHSMAVLAHERARMILAADTPSQSRVRLTQLERDCLVFVARGKSDWVASELLGVRERNVHRAIERAKRRLGVATRVQAVVRALSLGIIAITEISD